MKTVISGMPIPYPRNRPIPLFPPRNQPQLLNRICHRLLLNMLETEVYWEFTEIEDFLTQNQHICNAVLQELRSREPIINIRPIDAKREKNSVCGHPIPISMRPYYRRVNVSGDGNCWYHAISMCLYGHQNYVALIRFATLIELTRRWDDYFKRFVLQHEGNNADLLKCFLSVGTMSDDWEILQEKFTDDYNKESTYAEDYAELATSIAINREILMYSDGLLANVVKPSAESRSPIIVRLDELHFEAYIPLHRKTIIIRPEQILGLKNMRTGQTMFPLGGETDIIPRIEEMQIDDSQ